jgi:hypothetical protein
MLKSFSLAAVVLVACIYVQVAGSQAQPDAKQSGPPAAAAAAPVIPDKYTNLQVLPKEIEKSDLLAIMKGLCRTMKVRCTYCHVATDDLSSADFPSDEKPPKQSARELLRKLSEIQRKYPTNAARAFPN